MSVDLKIYDETFYHNADRPTLPSVRAVVKILIKHFSPKSVVDIGCGNGLYLAEFAKSGREILGFDGSPAAIKMSSVADKIKLFDLTESLRLNRHFDLCLCLELAEHLPLVAADILINSLTSLASSIVFTAATPGQGPRSIGHINEQPHQFWIKKFKAQYFAYNKSLTHSIKQEMEQAKVVWWLSKNLMIFQKYD